MSSSGLAQEGEKRPLLLDLMGSDKRINVFMAYMRNFEDLTARLGDATSTTTILAPLNSAVERSPHKPWEDPNEYQKFGSNAYDGDEGRQRADVNRRRFLNAHLVPTSSWKEGERIKTLGGTEAWWEQQSGVRKLMPWNAEVEDIGRHMDNGEIWVIKQVLK